MRNKLLVLLLLPFSLWAADKVQVTRTVPMVQPAHTVERVSKRTSEGLVFQDSLHFAQGKYDEGNFILIAQPSGGRLNYDSAGVMKKIDLTERTAKTAGYEKRVNVGPSVFEYDSTGRIRYEKNGHVLEAAPGFTSKQVGINFHFNSYGLKADYILSETSPTRLAWGLKDPDGIAQRKIQPFTALDAAGKPVNLTASYKQDSLIVTLNTFGALFPVTVDPSIQDTADAGTSGQFGPTGTNWKFARDSLSDGIGSAVNNFIVGRSDASNYRSAISLDLSGYAATSVIDSTRFFWYNSSGPGAGDSIMFYGVAGNFSGSFAAGWYNDIQGWDATAAYTPSYLTAQIKVPTGQNATWFSALFTIAGKDSITAQVGLRTLRMMILSSTDISGDSTEWAGTSVYSNASATKPYFIIYYHAASQPGLTTGIDTLAVLLHAAVDSTGGKNLTSRGFKVWPKGGTLAGDTLTVSESGSLGTGDYALYADSLIPDTLYRYKAYGINAAGTSYGALDSFSTSATGGGTVTIYDTTFIRRGGFGGKFGR